MAILISLLLALLAQLSLTLDLSVSAGTLLYIVAAYLFSRSLRGHETDGLTVFENGYLSSRGGTLSALGAKKRFECLAVLALLLIASFFRLYRIDSQPLSLSLDEGLTGINALEIIEGRDAPIWEMTPLDRWKPEWVKTSNLYLHYVVLVLRVFGPGYFGLKMVSLLPAIASVLAVYFLFKEVTDRSTAFLSAFFTAVSQWHVTISRWGWDAVLMCFLQLVSYGFLMRGVKTDKKLPFVLSGALMGLCLYTYIASWIAFFIALTYLAIRAIRKRHELGTAVENSVLFFLSCLLVFAPLGSYYFRHPGDLVVRTSEIAITKAIAEAQNYDPLWQNIKNHALMFNYKGDSNPRHGFPGEPVLDFVSSIFFVLGLVYCVRFWKRTYNLFLLLWFVLGIQGGLLADPAASPHAYRTAMVIPVACFFVAASMGSVLSAASRSALKVQYKNMVALTLGAALLSYIVFANYSTHFVRRPKSRVVLEEEGRDGRLPLKIQSLQKQSPLILVDPLFVWKIVVTNSWFLTYQPGKLFEPVFMSGNLLMIEPKLARFSGERQLVYFFPLVFRRIIHSLFPYADIEAVLSPWGEPVYGAVKITVADLRARLQVAEKDKLAEVLSKVALFYEQQLPADAEIGPRRQLLLDESRNAIDFARQLDRGRPLRPLDVTK